MQNESMAMSAKVNVADITLSKRLEDKKKRLQREMDEIDEALKIVKSNPDMEKFLNIVSSTLGRLY